MQLVPSRAFFSSVTEFVRLRFVPIAIIFLAVFATFFFLNSRNEIVEAVNLIARISPVWILALAGLQAAVLSLAGMSYSVLLRRQGYRIGLVKLIEIHLRRVVIGAVTPLGGPASVYVLVRSLRAHRVSDSDALILASIRGVVGVLAFLLFLIPALLLQAPSTLVLAAASGLALVLLSVLVLMTAVLRQKDVPRFVRAWSPQPVQTFIDTAKAHQLNAGDFVLPTLIAFLSHATTASMLFVGLNAIGYSAEAGTVLIGYVIGKLFFMMAPVFQGIGIVEIGMALALQQAGVPGAVAVGGALLYRIGDLWLPLFLGVGIQLVRSPVHQRAQHHLRTLVAWINPRITAAARGTAPSERQMRHLASRALPFEAHVPLAIAIWILLAAGLPSLG